MEREIEAKLQEWKDYPDRKPLVIRGARQVGKTYTVEKFGRESFESFIRIDFEKEIGLKAVFEGDLLPRRIFERILLAKDVQT
ncbi:MAG: AAA family ATPase, partial [Chitinivibrionales bacterium]